MKSIVASAVRIGVGLAMVVTAGCYRALDADKPHSDQPLVLPKPGPQQIVVDSRLAFSAEENQPAAEAIVERARLLNAEGGVSLEKLVQRWPDITLEMLRNSIAAANDFQLRSALARSYDHAFGATNASAGWYAALSIVNSRPQAYEKFRAVRQNVLNLLQSGRFAEAARVDLFGTLPTDAPPALKAEALRLTGLADLLDEKPGPATDVLGRAVVFANGGPVHPQFELGLLLTEAERRRGSLDRAAGAWTSATSRAAAANVRDPNLWERGILSKPENMQWPSVDLIGGNDIGVLDGATPPDTGDVLIAIGKMRFSRHAFQPALLAFSRAEAETAVKAKQDLARLYRAQAMMVVQQPASALPMLEALVQSSDHRIASRAKAVEGDLLCRLLDDRRHGIPMMREALSEPGDWPGLSQLSANLGLYCILEGLTAEGFQRLHQSEARFTADGQMEDLVEALKNEAACLRFVKKDSDADIVQARADDLCRKFGLAVGPLTANAASSVTEDGTARN